LVMPPVIPQVYDELRISETQVPCSGWLPPTQQFVVGA
jgi:hypothetical protein